MGHVSQRCRRTYRCKAIHRQWESSSGRLEVKCLMEDFDTIINEFWAFDDANKAHSVSPCVTCINSHHQLFFHHQSTLPFHPFHPFHPSRGIPPPKWLVTLLPRPFFLKLPGHQNPKARPGESEKSCVASVGSAYGSNLLLAWSKSEKNKRIRKKRKGCEFYLYDIWIITMAYLLYTQISQRRL